MEQLGLVEPKRECLALKSSPELSIVNPTRACTLIKSSSLAETGTKASDQPRLSRRKMRSTTVGGCRHADTEGLDQGGISLRGNVGVKPNKTTKWPPFTK